MSASFTEYTLKRGDKLIAFEEYQGEEDWNKIQKALIEIINPEDSGYSVDSLCIAGYIRKDDILIKTSSESPYDCCSIIYNSERLSANQMNKLQGWLDQLIQQL